MAFLCFLSTSAEREGSRRKVTGSHETGFEPLAGVQLVPGTYTVTPYSSEGHIYFACSKRTTAFLINLSGSTLLYSVGHLIMQLATVYLLDESLHACVRWTCAQFAGLLCMAAGWHNRRHCAQCVHGRDSTGACYLDVRPPLCC